IKPRTLYLFQRMTEDFLSSRLQNLAQDLTAEHSRLPATNGRHLHHPRPVPIRNQPGQRTTFALLYSLGLRHRCPQPYSDVIREVVASHRENRGVSNGVAEKYCQVCNVSADVDNGSAVLFLVR